MAEYHPKYTILDMMRETQGTSLTTETPKIKFEEWQWNCSEEIKNILTSMGVYDTMKYQMFVIENSNNKRDIDIAKSKMEAVSKIMSIFKNSTSVYNNTGGDDDDKVSDIHITMTRSDGQK